MACKLKNQTYFVCEDIRNNMILPIMNAIVVLLKACTADLSNRFFMKMNIHRIGMTNNDDDNTELFLIAAQIP